SPRALAWTPSMQTSPGLAPVSRPARIPVRRVIASAPMRVSFAGGGTDLPPFVPGVPGRIVGSAIDLRVRVLVEPFDRGCVQLEAPAIPCALTRRRGEPARTDVNLRLLEAALAGVGIEEGVRVRGATA